MLLNTQHCLTSFVKLLRNCCYGASDSSIKNAVPNDIPALLKKCPITAVFTTGKKAHELYRRFFPGILEDICLPSPSPANRAVSEEKMLEEYGAIAEILK